MPVEPSFGELKSDKSTINAPPPEAPFRIVVLGDFSGRANRGETGASDDIAGRKSYKIGRDNFDDILKKVGVKLTLTDLPEIETAELAFTALDDIHPDVIYDQVGKIADLDSSDQAKVMSAILHHPDFQGIESAWRGLYWLLARLKEFRQVHGVLVDVSQAEFCADLLAHDDLRKTGLYQLLVEKPAAKVDGQPWALLIGLYEFGFNGDHVNALGRMAKIAREAAAPFLAAAPVAVAGKDWVMGNEVAAVWDALRKRPEAAMLGLALPRFLLRLPYGSNTKSIDRFEYEEWPGVKGPDVYLWGNPALAVACLLAQSFAKEGWPFKPGKLLDLTGMVMHTYTDEDDDRVGRMAEAMLTRKEGEKVGPMGLMNFVCSKDRDIMQLLRFQSVAEPAKGQPLVELLGQWGQKGAIKLPSLGAKPGISATVVAASGPAPAAPAAVASEAAAEEAPAEEEAPAREEAPAEEEAAAAAGGSEEMDPELAALMSQLEGGGEAAAAEEKPAESAASEEMDPELAALMKQLEGGGEAAPAEEKKEEAPAEEMDPELAALMKQLEGGGDTSTEEKKEEKKEDKPAEEEMDPELAALLKQLEGES